MNCPKNFQLSPLPNIQSGIEYVELKNTLIKLYVGKFLLSLTIK